MRVGNFGAACAFTVSHLRSTRTELEIIFYLSAFSAPLRESIVHAEAQRTQRFSTIIKAVRVERRRDTPKAPTQHKQKGPEVPLQPLCV